MRYKDLNNKGLYSMRMNDFMQMGGQPMVQENTNMMEQIVPAIQSALDQGTPLVQIIIALAQNQVPIEAIQQSLMSVGVSQEEFMTAVQELQQAQAQAQDQTETIESPIEAGPPQEMEGSMPEGMPMAQTGGTTTIGIEDHDINGESQEIPKKFKDKYHHYKPTTMLNEEDQYYKTFGDVINNIFKASPKNNPYKQTIVFQDGGSTPSLDDPKYIEMLNSYGVTIDYDPTGEIYNLKNYNDPENIIMRLPSLPDVNKMEEYRILDLLPSDVDVYNMQSEYMKGGEKYSNILNKAQYGLGIANPASLSQYYGMLEDPSYRPNIKSAYLPMNLKSKGNVYGALSTLGEAAGRLFGTAENSEGLAVGAFRDLKAKKAAHEENKAKKYNYDINIDPNDPNVYSGSAVDLYRASSKNPFKQRPLRTVNEAMREGSVRYNPETMDYTYTSSPQSKYHDKGFESFGAFQDRMQSLPEETKTQLRSLARDIDEFKNAQQNEDLPEGTQFGVNEFGESVYYAPGTDISDSQSQMNARLTGYAFKTGGSYDNPGFKALPPQVQAKIMRAQMGTEMSASMGNSNFMKDVAPMQMGGIIPPMAQAPMNNQMGMFNDMMSTFSQAENKGRKYKNLSPHINDEIELTTEQIAKIMAAGGSVKIL